MTELVGYLASGLVAGAIFAVMASGLTLSYAATGVLNFAHGAVGFVSALLFFQLTDAGWPPWLAALVTIGLVAPLLA
jgi:branched-subunit amino acid ABC-type transport system permease component